MATDPLQKMLSMTPVLKGMSIDEVRRLFSVAQRVNWKAGQEVFIEDEVGRDMYILCGGMLSVWLTTAGRGNPIAILKPGDNFGEMALVGNGKRTANVLALDDAYGIRINSQTLNNIPSVGLHIFRNISTSLSMRLVNSNHVVAALQAGETVPQLEAMSVKVDAVQVQAEETDRKELEAANNNLAQVPMASHLIPAAIAKYGQLEDIVKRFNTIRSAETFKRLQADPDEWVLYQTLLMQSEAESKEDPLKVLAQWLKNRPDWTVGDFGCGTLRLKKLIENSVIAMDFVSSDASVLACDMSNTSIPEQTLDVAVFVNSIMGVNFPDYFKEAFRLLKFGGHLKIAEKTRLWADSKAKPITDALNATGFRLLRQPTVGAQYFYIDAFKDQIN
jgi:CRP-like cAMP-binding protein